MYTDEVLRETRKSRTMSRMYMRCTDELRERGIWNEYVSKGTWGRMSRWVALTLLVETNRRNTRAQALKAWTIELDSGDGEEGMGMSDAEPEDG